MPASIPRYLLQTASRLPDKIAIVSPAAPPPSASCKESTDHREGLREIGLVTGDRVGICMEKTVDQAVAILGVLFANAVVVPILPRLKGPNIRHIIENSGMAAMITDTDRLDEVTEFAGLTQLITGHGEVIKDWPNLPYLRRSSSRPVLRPHRQRQRRHHLLVGLHRPPQGHPDLPAQPGRRRRHRGRLPGYR